MVNENNNINQYVDKKPFELVQEVNNEIPSFEEFMKGYEGDANYDDLSGGDVGIQMGYGPCSKWCSYCDKSVSVYSYSCNYCPKCGTAFGTVTKKTTGLQKLNNSATQNTINNLGERVERSGGEVKIKVGDEDVEITYRRS